MLGGAALMLVIIFSVAAFPQQVTAEPKIAPLPLDVLFAMPKFTPFGSIALSPDGQLVVYSVCFSMRKSLEKDPRYGVITRSGTPRIFEGCELRIINTETRETTNLINGGNSWFPVWSPNGKRLAFYSDRDGFANLWIWERSTRKPWKVSDLLIRSSGRSEPQWMPDNKGVVATVLPKGMTLDQAVSSAATEAARKGPSSNSEESSVVVYKAGPDIKNAATAAAFDTNQFLSDLVLFEIDGKKTRPIAAGEKIWGVRVSPDGKSIAFANEAGFKSVASHIIDYKLHIFDVTSSRTVDIPPSFNMLGGRTFSWSPDSRKIAYCTLGGKADCFVVSREGGDPKNVTPGDHPSFSRVDRLPLWDGKSENVYVLSTALASAVAEGRIKADSDAIWRININESSVQKIARIADRTIMDVALPSRSDHIVSADGEPSLVVLGIDNQTKRMGFHRVNLKTGTNERLYDGDEVIASGTLVAGYMIDVSADGKTIAYLLQSSQSPPEIYISDNQFRNPRKLTNLGAAIGGTLMGKAKLIDWRGNDNKLYRGAVLLPSGYREGQAYPTIVYPYPGSTKSEFVNLFGLSSGTSVENMQIFASRGYAVFFPDMPEPQAGRPMHSVLEGIMPALNKIIDLGIADANRLGVMGNSYGGYMVLSFIVQTNRFKAAVARAGSYDLASQYGYMTQSGSTFAPAWAETGQGRMGGTPWEFRERYIENSPFFYLDRVETPLLLIHGSEDPTSSPFNADQTFVGLRRLGKAVEYAKYMGEEHSENVWGYANQLDYLNRVIAWFDKYLKAPEKTVSTKQ
jgi:dipeptidyl aminopeptidase/acylaminoacyl peptidase